jgi:hypothetical protein
MSELLHFNGLDAETGAYLLPPMPLDRLAELARGAPASPEAAEALRTRLAARKSFALAEGLDPADLAQAGWGLVLPAAQPGTPEHAAQQAILSALEPLIALRRAQASATDPRRFRLFTGPAGLRPGESKTDFLARHGAGAGPVDPWLVPYYLLLVGDPAQLPFRTGSLLDVQHAVGRLHFDAPEHYAAYADSVVAIETGAAPPRHGLHLFGVANPDDPATAASARDLIAPLGAWVQQRRPEWDLGLDLAERATKARLTEVLSRERGPALLLTASHGAGFRRTSPRQRAEQGALICQDWTGPLNWGDRPLGPEVLFTAADLPPTDLRGLIAFVFACYGAGTPVHDGYSTDMLGNRRTLADAPFLSELPRRMLCHPPGGALAVIGHVDRAWTTSFLSAATGTPDNPGGQQLAAFRSVVVALMKGTPVGAALETFNQRYAELATLLADALENDKYVAADERTDPATLATLWTAHNDARGYVIIGDPAVRLGPPLPVPPATTGPPPPATPPSPSPSARLDDFGLAGFGLVDAAPQALTEVHTEPARFEVTTRVDGQPRATTTISRDGTLTLDLHGEPLSAAAWQAHQDCVALAWQRWK